LKGVGGGRCKIKEVVQIMKLPSWERWQAVIQNGVEEEKMEKEEMKELGIGVSVEWAILSAARGENNTINSVEFSGTYLYSHTLVVNQANEITNPTLRQSTQFKQQRAMTTIRSLSSSPHC